MKPNKNLFVLTLALSTSFAAAAEPELWYHYRDSIFSPSATGEQLDAEYRNRANELRNRLASEELTPQAAKELRLLRALQLARVSGALAAEELAIIESEATAFRLHTDLPLELRYELAVRTGRHRILIDPTETDKSQRKSEIKLYKDLITDFPTVSASYESLLAIGQSVGAKLGARVADFLVKCKTTPAALIEKAKALSARETLLNKKFKEAFSRELEDAGISKVGTGKKALIIIYSSDSKEEQVFSSIEGRSDLKDYEITYVRLAEGTSRGKKAGVKPGKVQRLVEKLGFLEGPVYLYISETGDVVNFGGIGQDDSAEEVEG
ncbi:MAG: hypothetical protein SFV32_13865 [Opitutaceae bacterium]|nr:hypothetical protein [Opitutaceae bacterium]